MTVGKSAEQYLFDFGGNPVAFDHSVERSAIDTHDLSGASAIATGGLENMKQVASLGVRLMKVRSPKQSRQRRSGTCFQLRRLKLSWQVFWFNLMTPRVKHRIFDG